MPPGVRATSTVPLRHTTFYANGPHTDVFSLHRLARSERRILYVDPLFIERNRRRIRAFRDAHDMHRLSSNDTTLFDGLFGEGDCVGRSDGCQDTPVLNSSHIEPVVSEVLRGLEAMSASGVPCGLAHSGLTNLVVLRHRLSYPGRQGSPTRPPRLTVNFRSDGVLRTLVYVFGRFEDIDLARELTDPLTRTLYPISTFMFVGTGDISLPSFRALCQPNPTLSMPTFRIICSKEERLCTKYPRGCQQALGSSLTNSLDERCRAVHSSAEKKSNRDDTKPALSNVLSNLDTDGDGDTGGGIGLDTALQAIEGTVERQFVT